jgi:hypothetical protein
MEKETEQVVIFLIMLFVLVFEALKILLSILEKGIWKDRREILLDKTNQELRSMLVGVDKISRLNKNQLIDLILESSNHSSFQLV